MRDPTRARPMRADARHNRVRIIEATRQLLAEQGADVPLDQIATRAGVSIATLYRRFEDRLALLEAVVVEESAAVTSELEGILALLGTAPTRTAWETAMHDLVVSAHSRLVPALAIMNSGLLPDTPDLTRALMTVRGLMRSIVARAQDAGLVRPEVSPDEIMAMLFVATQPLAQLTVDDNRALTSRSVRVILAGLHPSPGHTIPGSPPRLDRRHDTDT